MGVILAFDTGRSIGLRAIPRVVQSIPFETSKLKGEVPAGFETDLESVPWFARWLLPRASRIVRESIIHDYLLTEMTEKAANEAMRELLQQRGFNDGRKYILLGSLWFWRVVRFKK